MVIVSAPVERRYGLGKRLLGLITRPGKVLADIGAVPDYAGPLTIIVLYVLLCCVDVWIILSKFHVTGPYADVVSAVFTLVLAGVVLAGALAMPVRWVIKSLIVWKVCDRGSGWSLKKALSVTGYAYLADLVLYAASLVITALLAPTFYFETTTVGETLRRFYSEYLPQLKAIFVCGLALKVGALVWKSYLGAVGTYYGTGGACSERRAFAIFMGLGSITIILGLINLL